MKHLSLFTIFILMIAGLAFGETPELMPLNKATEADTQLDDNIARAARIYTDLVWAVYCRTGEHDIRNAKNAYNALIAESKLNGESVEDKILSKHDISFIYTERASLRYLNLQDLRGAEEDVRIAIELDPENVDAKWVLAQILRKWLDQNGHGKRSATELIEEMLSVGKQITELDPDHSEGHYYLGSIARHVGNAELAITSFKALTRIMPFRAQFHLELAELYEEQERPEEALQAYERVLTILPENIGLRNYLVQLYQQNAERYERQNRFEDALLSYEKVLNLSPNDINAHYSVGVAYQTQNNFEKAEHHIARAVTLLEERNSAMRRERSRSRDRIMFAQELRGARHQLAQLYLKFNMPQKAVQNFEKILTSDKNYVPALTGIGIAYQMLNDVKRSENYLRKAVERSSTEEAPDAYNALGYLYAEQGINLDEAETLVRQALKSVPTSGAYLDSLGLIFFKQGKLDAAIENLEQADRYLPDTPEILSHLADAYLKKGLEQKAVQTLEHALSLQPDNTELQTELQHKLEVIRSIR